MKDKLTKHFSFSELTHTDVKELQEENTDQARNYLSKIKELAEFAEQVREIIGCPMIVTSAFRCEKLNAKLGGSPTSQHRFGEAIDFIPKDMSAFSAFTKIIISNIEYGQLILCKRGISHFIHISVGKKHQCMYSEKIGSYRDLFPKK